MLDNYRGNLKWLKDSTILYVWAGSHAYGTNTESSDEDFRGVCVPPLYYRHGFLNKFEQATIKDPDVVVYDIRKFFKLAVDCNPSILEILFTDDLIVCTDEGKCLLDHRDRFLSQKVFYTFRGYARSQLKRINSHRRWLLNPPRGDPTRAEFGLPENGLADKSKVDILNKLVKDKINEWHLDFTGLDNALRINIEEQIKKYLVDIGVGKEEEFRCAARFVNIDDATVELLTQEARYRQAKREWKQYNVWLAERNPERAKLEREFKYDSKNASHLIRLYRMCTEILSGQGVIVKRPDSEELLEIRNGKYSFDELLEEADKLEQKCNELVLTTLLPRQSDKVWLDQLCCSITESTTKRLEFTKEWSRHSDHFYCTEVLE